MCDEKWEEIWLKLSKNRGIIKLRAIKNKNLWKNGMSSQSGCAKEQQKGQLRSDKKD